MSEEEKEIETYEEFEEALILVSEGQDYIQCNQIENYVLKLLKENEYYKKENSRIKKDLNIALNYSKKYTISKDKIRELREIDNIDYLQFKLKELLGE